MNRLDGAGVSSAELVAQLAARAPAPGGNTGAWPGLTIYRFTAPTGPTWEEIRSLSLCIVAQGRKAVTADGRTYVYDPSNYLVLGSNLTFEATILEATPARPFLSFVLQIDPAVVRRVSAGMRDSDPPSSARRPAPADHRSFVSPLDRPLLDSVLRFLASTATPPTVRSLRRSTCRRWSTASCSASSSLASSSSLPARPPRIRSRRRWPTSAPTSPSP